MQAAAILSVAQPTFTAQSFYVYVHKRDDGEIFYVGKGRTYRAWSFNKRNAHWHAVRNKHGLIVEVVAYFTSEYHAFEHERLLIAECRAAGIRLANKSDGGEGSSGVVHSVETRAHWSAVKLGKKLGHYSAEHRRKISEGNRGRAVPVERRARIAKATANAMRDPAIIMKMRLAKLGKKRAPHSEATKAKMSAAAIGKRKSTEARANMSIAQRKRFRNETSP